MNNWNEEMFKLCDMQLFWFITTKLEKLVIIGILLFANFADVDVFRDWHWNVENHLNVSTLVKKHRDLEATDFHMVKEESLSNAFCGIDD